MKKVLRLLIPLAIVGAGFGIWKSQQAAQSADGSELNLYGNVDTREVSLAINGSGRIAEMAAEEGDVVHEGQVLARIDAVRQQAVRDRAAAQLAAQTAVVARMHAGSRPEDIERARAELAAAQVQAKDAARTAARLHSLSSKDLASKQQADVAGAQADAAAEHVRAGRQLLNLAEQGPRKEDIAAAEAMLTADKAQLALAESELDDTTLRAPADGIIRNRILEPGDMANPARPVYTLALTNPMWVRAYVAESDLGRIRPGMVAQVSTDSFPGKAYRGWVGYISPTAEFTPQTVQTEELRTQLVYQVRVFVCNPQGELRLGMPASVHVDLQQQVPAAGNDPCSGS